LSIKAGTWSQKTFFRDDGVSGASLNRVALDRLRWKIENEGFNVQKNLGGFNLEHPYSQDPNASKVFYLLCN